MEIYRPAEIPDFQPFLIGLLLFGGRLGDDGYFLYFFPAEVR